MEINSLASLGAGGSLPAAAKTVGMDYDALIQRLVEVASARYFGAPEPPIIQAGPKADRTRLTFSFLTQRRYRIERDLQQWCALSSRTSDPIGYRKVQRRFGKIVEDLSLQLAERYSDDRSAWLWETKRGFEGGTLLISQLDVPLTTDAPIQAFQIDPEFLYGEGIGVSRAPLVSIEYILKALKARKVLHRISLGVMVYSDEGCDARYSKSIISKAAKKAGTVLVICPQTNEGKCAIQRRGSTTFVLSLETKPIKLGQAGNKRDALSWAAHAIEAFGKLTSRKKRLAVAVTDIKPHSFPLFLPHRVEATISMSYYDEKVAIDAKQKIDEILKVLPSDVVRDIEEISNRPPFKERSINRELVQTIRSVADTWQIPFDSGHSLSPSVAGLVPKETPVVCGLGPAAEDVNTPKERIHRISLIRQILLTTQYILAKNEIR